MGTQIRYKGPFDQVEVPALDKYVPRLKWIEVDTEIAKSLLEQEDNWERPAPKSKEGDN
jgi:hypothetical protein